MNKKSLAIGIDIGGTKIAAGIVSDSGRILSELKEPVVLDQGPKGLIRQLNSIINGLLPLAKSKLCGIGIGSAGPLHAPSGSLLDPTNFGWKAGKVPIVGPLQKNFRAPISFDNDAAAAALAEQWKGGGGDDFIVLTLGTGLGVGVMVEGKTLRGSRGLHPEAGHLLLRPGDTSAPCGCGNLGCAEGLLAGSHFVRRTSQKVGRTLSAPEIVQAAKEGAPWALESFSEYGELLGEYTYNLCMLFYPKQIILAGSFASASSLFIPGAQRKLRSLLKRQNSTLRIMPKLRPSRLANRSGLLGAARLAFLKETYWLQ
jgi:glucokinase